MRPTSRGGGRALSLAPVSAHAPGGDSPARLWDGSASGGTTPIHVALSQRHYNATRSERRQIKNEKGIACGEYAAVVC